MTATKWPKLFPPLTADQQIIREDFVKYWHEVLASRSRYELIEKFNHGYVLRDADEHFLTTLEIGAGLGEHLEYEVLNQQQTRNYHALELRESMASTIRERYPDINVLTADCQKTLPFEEGCFDRIIAIHVLEHLPDLPSAAKEMYRLINRKVGRLSIVIPCEGGLLYSLARKISAQRIFEKRYKQSYRWFIEREHVNRPNEIMQVLSKYFHVEHKKFFPFRVPLVNFNLCIGVTLRPR